jgi:RNA polymerase sigma-70 factor (ECF subfamily)
MVDDDLFEQQRPRLRGLAYRMLGSLAEADDVAQEAWLRWQGADRSSIARPEAWLTTVATRLALDRIRQRDRVRDSYPGPWLPEPLVCEPGPEEAAELADSLTLEFLVLLDQLTPVERAVFVLADVFDVPFAEISAAVGRSEVACRQIASRARRRLRPEKPPATTTAADRELLSGLLQAVAAGDVDAVIARLAPDVVCVSDGGPQRRAARRPVVGPHRVSRLLVNLAHRFLDRSELRPATVNGAAGLIGYLDGRLDQVWAVETDGGRISAIRIVRNPEKLASLGHPMAVE